MEQKTASARKFTWKEKMAALGPGFLIVGSFIGPGTVTSSTRAGATYGFQLFWCVIFSVIAVIVVQGMSARLGIITQEGLAENLKNDFADRPLLRNLLCGLVALAIVIGGFAYMGGDLTGTALGISALTGVSTKIIAPVWGFCILLILNFAGDAVKYLEKLLGICVIIMAVVFMMTMVIVRPDLGAMFAGCVPSIPENGGLMTCLSLIGTTVVPYNMFLHAASAKRTWHSAEVFLVTALTVLLKTIMARCIQAFPIFLMKWSWLVVSILATTFIKFIQPQTTMSVSVHAIPIGRNTIKRNFRPFVRCNNYRLRWLGNWRKHFTFSVC